MTPRDVMPLNQHVSMELASDGVYLVFETRDGRSAILRIESIATERPGMNSDVLLTWCHERRQERQLEIEGAKFDIDRALCRPSK